MKILIVKTSSLGDVVQAWDVLLYLKNKFPDCEIDWVVEKKCASLISCHPYVTSPLEIDTKRWKKRVDWRGIKNFIRKLKCKKYDVAFDLQGNIKSGLILAFARAKEKVGFKKPREFPNRFFTNRKIDPPIEKNMREAYLYLVQSYFQDTHFPNLPLPLLKCENPKSNFSILVFPFSFWPNKELGEKNLISFLKRLALDYTFVSGNEKESAKIRKIKEHFPESTILENLTLPELHHAINGAKLVIAMDSFPLHLALATKTPTFSFFGPTMSSKFLPNTGPGYFQGRCPYGKSFEKLCPELRSCKTGACLKEANVDHIYEIFNIWQKENSLQKS